MNDTLLDDLPHVNLSQVDFGDARQEPDYSELDPNIRETVRWLRDNDFDTCDSGDGSKSYGLPYPHVYILIGDDQDLRDEADRLHDLLVFKGVRLFSGPRSEKEAARLGVNFVPPPEGAVLGYLTASYSPGQPAILELAGVHDGLLK